MNKRELIADVFGMIVFIFLTGAILYGLPLLEAMVTP